MTADSDIDGLYEASDFTARTAQSLNIEASSNRLLGFTQVVTTTNNNRTRSVVTTPVNYAIDANGSMTSDGLRDFAYDATGRLAKVRILKDGEAASVRYLTNALGQRVFKGEPTSEQVLPSETALGQSFIDWLKQHFSWLFEQAQANTSVGTAYVYAEGDLPAWAVLGEYDNGSSKAAGRSEYIWLPTADGAIPVGMFRASQLFAVHTDHLGTPRLMRNAANDPVWQWPYSAFGENKPTGVLKATPNPRAAITNQPVLLRTTAPPELNLRFPGQLLDDATGWYYNYFRDYVGAQGRYAQADPIGLAGDRNRYTYAEGNPLSYSDPNGLQAQALIRLIPPALVSLGVIEASRPRNMSRLEERQFDRYCTGPADPCLALKAAAQQAIADAIPKMNNLLQDPFTLFRNAYSTPNPTVTGSPTTWLNHKKDLEGKIANINAIIALGQKMGCDMSSEIAAAGVLYIPNAPYRP